MIPPQPIQLRTIDSKSELRERLRSLPHVLLGVDDECTREFFIAQTQSGAIGICSQGHGIPPCVLIDESGAVAWAGYNFSVASVDLHPPHLNFVVTLDWLFYEFLRFWVDGSVLVLHELGAVRISRSGDTIWTRSTDVVADQRLEGDVLRLDTHSGEIRIDIESGAVGPNL